MKMTAAATVTLLKKLAGPRLPNTVWLEPPNAAPISAPLPACSKMAAIIKKQTETWSTTVRVYITERPFFRKLLRTSALMQTVLF